MPTPKSPARRTDPLFICMVAAMVLAVISSLALRAYLPSNPPSARADTVSSDTPSDPADSLEALPPHTHMPKK